jgi:alanine-synthesizing transaminase
VDFFAELEKAIQDSWPRPKMLVLNFPANPTTQCVELEFLREGGRYCPEHGIWVVHDMAYAEIVFDGYKAPSILQVPGAKDVAVEFYTPVQELQHAGLARGLHVRQPEAGGGAGADQVLPGLRHLHADPGGGDRRAGGAAGLRARRSAELYRAASRRALRRAQRHGLGRSKSPRRPCSSGRPSRSSTAHGFPGVLQEAVAEAKVAVSPGIGFGSYGDDHVRFSLIENEHRTRQALRGIKAMLRETPQQRGTA